LHCEICGWKVTVAHSAKDPNHPKSRTESTKEFMPRHHLIISGTGRAGTTFLVQLLTELGLDTGFANSHAQIYENANAGMEFDIRNPNAPYIIKSPGLCDYLDDALQGDEIIVDYAIIPMRDLYSAAQSRRHVTSKADPNLAVVPGGLWPTEKIGSQEAKDQEWILAEKLYKLMYTLAKHDIPVFLLLFPRFAGDPEYLYQKLKFIVADIPYDTFLRAFQAISKPELVHDFRQQNNSKDNLDYSNLVQKSVVHEQTRQLMEKEQVEQELKAQLSQKEQALQEIFNSRAWKFVMALRRLRAWLLPPGSSREQFVRFLTHR
jgi:hypothetical protein